MRTEEPSQTCDGALMALLFYPKVMPTAILGSFLDLGLIVKMTSLLTPSAAPTRAEALKQNIAL